MDNHHPAGKANSPVTAPRDVNDHRAILSVRQNDDWPKKTLENPTGDPYLKMAAEIRGYINDRRYLEETLLRPAIEKLEAIAAKNNKTEE
jgi:hypothetical protein